MSVTVSLREEQASAVCNAAVTAVAADGPEALATISRSVVLAWLISSRP